MASEASSRSGWALLIGIDTYPHFNTQRQLGGCVNDVEIMRDALVRRFGFQEDRINVLTNKQATRAAILAAFEDLVSRVGKDESVIVHYSGHGSQKPDGPEKDEPDGWDETLVPCDSGRAPYPNRDITDDEIHDWLQRLMARNPSYITLIFDCCNSGTIFREAKTRGLPRDERGWVPVAQPQTVFRDALVGSKSWLKNGQGEKCVLFAACHSAELANEILVGDSPQVPHGALTYFLVQELMSPDFKGATATCTEVFERLRPGLKGRCKDQNPQLEGARNRELFGQATILPMPFVSVLDRKDDRVTLEAGATCGLVKDTPWIVYAPGTRAIDDHAIRLGTVSIVSVVATTSEAKVVGEVSPGAVIPGARAVEGFARLTVDLAIPPGQPQAEDLAVAIARSNLLARSRPRDRVDARISLRLTRDGEAWVVTDGNDVGLLAPELSCREPGALRTLVETLERVARLHRLASVTNPDSGLKGLVDFEILRWTPAGGVPPLRDERGVMLFHEGDRLVLVLRNRSSVPLHVNVLDVGLTGRVAIAYPWEGAQEVLESGQTHQVGSRAGEELTLSLPQGYDHLPEAVRKDRETLKLIASTSPVELRLLFQTGQRYRTPWKEDWTTVEKTFRLVPKA